MFYWIKTHWVIKWIFKNQIWSIDKKNTLYLTFDDGPTPQITEWVLDILKQENIKAAFFCIGENVQKYPEIFNRIIAEGHSIGNHTYNHLNSWETNNKTYLENIEKCELMMEDGRWKMEDSQATENSKLFRPPYGKIKPSQSKFLRKKGYQIIMWDILTADFDTNISPEKCLQNATQKVTDGSIIVFHDSEKAFPNLEYTLPKAITYYKEKGFVFNSLN